MRSSVGVSTGAIPMGFSADGEDRDTGVVLGTNKNGQACKKCITKGDFCHLHVHQMHARFSGTVRVDLHDGARQAERNCVNRGEVFRTTHTGETLKRSIKQKKLCHQHPWQRQDGVDPRDIEQLRRPTEHIQHQTAVFGVTKRNESCKRCIKKNDFCYQHVSQRRDGDQAATPTTHLVWDDDISLTTTGSTVIQTKPRQSRQSRTLARNTSGPVLDDEPFWQPVMRRPSQLHHMPLDNVVRVAHVEVHSDFPSKSHWNTSTNITSPISTSVAEDKECCICMETVTSLQNHKELRCCNTSFHQTCLQRWRQSGSTCPICRASL